MKSCTGTVTTMGKGEVHGMSNKQTRLDVKGSTEAELVGVNDGMPHML